MNANNPIFLSEIAMAQFEFTSGNDTLIGTTEDDQFILFDRRTGGMDSVDGLGGIDRLETELFQGNVAIDLEAGFGAVELGIAPGDWVPGGVGTSFAIAGVEEVSVVNFDNRGLIRGDAQDNRLNLEFGQGEIYGGAGNDRITSYGGDIKLFGGAGDDRLFAINGASSGPVLVSGGPGTDTFATDPNDQGIELRNLTVSEVANGLLLSSGGNQYTLQNDVEFLELGHFRPTILSYAELQAMVPRRSLALTQMRFFSAQMGWTRSLHLAATTGSWEASEMTLWTAAMVGILPAMPTSPPRAFNFCRTLRAQLS